METKNGTTLNSAIRMKKSNQSCDSWFHGTGKLFDTFDVMGFGSHFGTSDQALAAPRGREYVYEVKLAVSSPLRLNDLYSWDPYDLSVVIEELFSIDLYDFKMEIGLAQGNPEKEKVFQSQVKQIIQSNGYDGVIYSNTMEGPGDSVIAFESDQIQIVKIRSRAEHMEVYK
ncbi:MAG: hypothetical protein KUG73_07080 [Pseudomonadales bacterium]|nr:hypothetical protein [Pseudomonadales bacterium]